MSFNKHSYLEGRHAFLSPSQYSWIRYDDEKLDQRFFTSLAAQRGTEEHDLAAKLIKLGIKLPATRKTLNLYVNDAIGYKMTPEQPLYYSDNCFGHVDALGFKRNKLRAFDLKTGEKEAKVDQLLVYAAIFCLEYHFKPFEIEYDLRLYQFNDVIMFETDPGDIAHIMDKIVEFDKRLNALKMEVT